MDGGNLVKMVNPLDKEIEILEDRENHNQLNDTTPKKRNDGSVPCEGMKFTSLEEFEKYYYAHAFSEGFTVRVEKTLKFDQTNIVRYRQYVCSCAGFCDAKQKSNDEVDEVHEDEERKRRKTLTRRSGCPVTITVSKDKGVWKVKTVNNKHNHLLVSPNSQTNLRQHRGIPSIAKKLIEKFSESDLPISKVPAIFNCDAEINVSQRSCWNHRRNLRLMNLDRGDADALFQYCKWKQVQDANFYYAIQTDDEDRLVNFFWIDSTAR